MSIEPYYMICYTVSNKGKVIIMKVSLVMAVYNGEKYLKEQLDSLRLQTHPLDEVLIIDDQSKDDSYIYVRQYIDGYQLKNWKIIKNEKNLGYRANFKKGLENVQGDIIFLCDQDDIWHLDKIETMVSYMKDRNVFSLASSFQLIDEDGKHFTVEQQKGKSNNNLLYQEVTELMTKIPLEVMLQSNFSQGCTMALKKELVDEYLKYTQLNIPHDWELNMIASIHDGCYFLNLPLINYRIHAQNTIGLTDVVDYNYLDKKKRRVNQRISFIDGEIKNVQCAFNLNLNSNQRKMCERDYNYLNKRKTYIEKKKLFSLLKFYITGNYREFGHFKTFIGDIIACVK